MKNRNISYYIYNKKTIERIKTKVNYLGLEKNIDTFSFLNFRFISCILLFIILLFFTKYGAILSPIGVIVYYIAIEKILLDAQIKKRRKRLEEESIFFFEILSLTLETNPYLKGALELTVRNIDSSLSNEFKKMLLDVKLGKSFSESLIDLKKSIPSDAINTIILNLTEASLFGNSISDSLKNQLNYLREKKILEIKGEISKLPTKISVLSVLFFIPIMLLLILAPLLLEFIT